MISSRLYYTIKPFVPRAVRLRLRGLWASRLRAGTREDWPILESAGSAPDGWTGWPEGKKFALVLTHDVEGGRGLRQVEQLAALETECGMRSSFNFIPEGGYITPPELREKLVGKGFEVGVHDLRHDGKLFRSRAKFGEQAKRINGYLQAWGAQGFRAGFMLRNLEWIHSLDIKYDASTFDTDPFEPQPDGVNTIFPFWVDGPAGQGYVELPYTLAQDSTLFLVLGEQSIGIWKRKLDWIAEKGGMALLNVHPDYLSFSGKPNGRSTYPAEFYREFLDYVVERHRGQFWNPLPREAAEFTVKTKKITGPARNTHINRKSNKTTIWIDLDNTPHVPFFEPIVEELKRRDFNVLLTVRDAFQVCELADKKGLDYVKVGRHHGKNPARKIFGLFYRALQLAAVVRQHAPKVAVSHGSRAQIILSNMTGIPSLLLADYEHAKVLPLMRPTWEMVPEIIPASALHCRPERVLKYPGIKEDVYVSAFKPDSRINAELGLENGQVVVTARPPAGEAHYHRPESDVLFHRFMENACRIDGVKVVMLPRNTRQGDELKSRNPHWFANGRTIIPQRAVDGLNLLWFSDLAVSGGGTMNREAAALGLPVYSVFRGTTGAVDQFLAEKGKLILIASESEVDSKIIFKKRPVSSYSNSRATPALTAIVEGIDLILKTGSLNQSAT